MLRLALYYGNLPFEDERISYDEIQKRRVAGILPGGQVPVLEIDGVPYGQSVTLLRWIGMRAGLFPMDLQLKIDAVHDAFADINKSLAPQWYGAILGRSPVDGSLLVPMTEEQKQKVQDILSNISLPASLARIEKNYTSTEYDFFFGSTPTTADFHWYIIGGGLMDGTYCEGLSTSVLDECPNLRKIIGNVGKLSRVAEWNAAHL